MLCGHEVVGCRLPVCVSIVCIVLCCGMSGGLESTSITIRRQSMRQEEHEPITSTVIQKIYKIDLGLHARGAFKHIQAELCMELQQHLMHIYAVHISIHKYIYT